MTESAIEISELTAAEAEAALSGLAEVLHACVAAGASVNFVLPFTPDQAAAFWRGKVLASMRAGTRFLFVARAGDIVVGTVLLDCDTPPNQPHRAEVTKLLVHPKYRRRGLGRRLMAAMEAGARRRGRELLTLDTRTGDMAEALYASLGFERAGVIPGYCLDVDGAGLDSTTIMYKRLGRAERGKRG